MRDQWLDRMPDVVARRSAGHSYDEIGQHYGVSRERIRQVIVKHRPKDATIRAHRGQRRASIQQRAEARRAVILAQYAAGGTIAEIGRQHSVSRCLVVDVLKAAKTLRPYVSPAKRILALAAGGMTQKEIGKQVGRRQSSVSSMMRRHGIRRFAPPSEWARRKPVILRLVAQGVPYATIAASYGVCRGTIQNWISRWRRGA